MLILNLGIARIWHYKRLSRQLRQKAGLDPLVDENDLPDPMYDPNHVQVLSDKQQEDLHNRRCNVTPIDTRLLTVCRTRTTEVHAQSNVVQTSFHRHAQGKRPVLVYGHISDNRCFLFYIRPFQSSLYFFFIPEGDRNVDDLLSTTVPLL